MSSIPFIIGSMYYVAGGTAGFLKRDDTYYFDYDHKGVETPIEHRVV